MSISPQEKSFGIVKDQLVNSILIDKMAGRLSDLDEFLTALTRAGIEYTKEPNGNIKIEGKTYTPSTVAKQLQGGGEIVGTEPDTWYSRLGRLFTGGDPYHERLLMQTAGQALPAALNLRFTYPFGRPGFRYYTDRHWTRIPNPGRYVRELAHYQKLQTVYTAGGLPYYFIIPGEEEEQTITFTPAQQNQFGTETRDIIPITEDQKDYNEYCRSIERPGGQYNYRRTGEGKGECFWLKTPEDDSGANSTSTVPVTIPLQGLVGLTRTFGHEGEHLAALFDSGILDSTGYSTNNLSTFSLGPIWGTMPNGLPIPQPLSNETIKKIKKLKATGQRGRNIPGLSCMEGTHDMADRIIIEEGLDKANGINTSNWNKKQKCALLAAYGLSGSYPYQLEASWASGIDDVPYIHRLYNILEEADLVDTRLFAHTADDQRLRRQLYGDQIKLYSALVDVTPRQVYSFPGMVGAIRRHY